jgi:branched-chain amino acid transport system ATP-binding protein
MTSTPETPLLMVDDIEAGYGPFRAIFGLSFNVRAGQAVALLGPNGAGKTTVARVCSGLVRPTAGTVAFDGSNLAHEAVHTLARRGLAHAPEGRSVFATLTVEENLVLGLHSRGSTTTGDLVAQAFDAFPRLAERRAQLAGTLSGGEQRMLSLARVLVGEPRLLIADELSLGLAPIIVEEVYTQLKAIQASGTALLLVEQQVGHALDLADEVVVLSQGKASYVGPADQIGEHSDYLAATGLAEEDS